MTNERTAALFDMLERQARQGLDEIAHLRQRLEALEAENRQLRDVLQQHSEALASASQSSAAAQEQSLSSSVQETATAAPAADGAVPMATAPEAPAAAEPDNPREPDASNGQPAAAAPSPQALLKEWYRRYTNTFFKGHTRPLKVGIHEDLLAREPWPEKLVRRALACYVHLPRYLKAVHAGAERVDLDGQPAGQVSDAEALHARQKLEALQARQKKAREKSKKHRTEVRKNDRLDQKLSELLAKHGRQ